MAFEAALGAVGAISLILGLMYLKSKKSNDRMSQEKVQLMQDKIRLEEEKIRLEEEVKIIQQHTADLPTMAKAVSMDVLQKQNEYMKSSTTDPMQDMMKEIRIKVEDLTKQSVENKTIFSDHMGHMTDTSKRLISNTEALAEIFRNERKRGRHAEIDLERVFELANLTKGIHYDTQQTDDEHRFDFVIRMSGDRSIIVDSKAPLSALYGASDADDEPTKAHYLKEHVKDVKGHIDNLAKKEYWNSEHSPLECVVMVMPEYALLPALDQDNDLVAYALSKKVVLVTPSTLLVLLRAVDLMWRQTKMVDTVKDVMEVASDLHVRLNKFAEYYNKTGKSLMKAVTDYNAGIGSWSRRVLPVTQKLEEAGVAAIPIIELNQAEKLPQQMPVEDDR